MRRAGVLLSGWLVASACSKDAMAPVAPAKVEAPQAAILSGSFTEAITSYLSATVLARVTELPADIAVSSKIGAAGGKIAIPQTGFEVMIPRGALKTEVTITVTALAGTAVAYDFQPHGIKFRKPLQFRQHFLYTEGWWNTLGGGYFKSSSQVDTESNTAKLDEEMPASMTQDGWIIFDIWHFSGYLVSCA
jgi:hypothetical protein